MCGIIAVLRRRCRRKPATRSQVQEHLAAIRDFHVDLDCEPLVEQVDALATHLTEANRLLSNSAGAACLLHEIGLADEVRAEIKILDSKLAKLNQRIDAEGGFSSARQELLNAALIRVKDSAWAIGRDRLETVETIRRLGGDTLTDSAIESYHSITLALRSLDRLEVRGRDSAGLQILVTGHGLDLESEEIQELIQPRHNDRMLTNGAVRTPDDHLAFIYKAAAEIGELGDNSGAMRAAICEDRLLGLALAGPDSEAVVLGHTRWASVGIISQANAHPVNHEELDRDGPYVAAVLNGDVDNFLELQDKAGIRIPDEITTDAKVIPILVSRGLEDGMTLTESFRQSVSEFVGSVAIGCSTASAPGKLHLALRGSGQGVFLGLAEDTFFVASEPYGVVEATDTYLRLDGETPGNPDNPGASQGQILIIDREGAGELDGIERIAYDGTPLPVTPAEIKTAEITTRDIDRGDNRHFLCKEITEAPQSFKKTLRGKIVTVDGQLQVKLGDESLPALVRNNLKNGNYQNVVVIGQGTAAVAGQGIAAAMSDAVSDTNLHVTAMPATELSGFHLRDDMSNTLIVAISQSGTTTDTNRTVDLARGRGASVLAVVNRRNSDLAAKADGVLYTSDGRDVEMSVASTKAFYSQIAAGFLLAFAIRQAIDGKQAADQQEVLAALTALPDALSRVLDMQDTISDAARKHASQRRYWAVVGNGKNTVAAEEIRIKLSELCYKSIACDTTEDKKHIDLSAEPLILVCAAGLTGSTADDVAKELAIYHAHKAAPILITSEDPSRFPGALETIQVPNVHDSVAFILSTMVGHLFGYYAAMAIDELANPLRLTRAAIQQLVSEIKNTDGLLLELEPIAREPIATFLAGIAEGRYDGQLEASTAIRLASHLGYVTGTKPLDSYETETGQVGTPALVTERLAECLTVAIEELTRPIDAIKHQAKTVTVGISRSDEALVTVPLVKTLLDAGAPRERISYRCLRALACLEPAIARVTGSTRYRIDGSDNLDTAEIHVVEATGSAENLASRTSSDPRLRGTKHLVASERQLMVARGLSDDRTFILVPEVHAGHSTGLTLLHVDFHDKISAAAMRGVLRGYRNRYTVLRDLVTETEPTFDERQFAELSVVELLTAPMHALADRWK
ncbi:MAG: SIS domain-containing protein [Planctomycetota bacterium]|nr:SIS domain-containing protein [Planctomycetota bacterium]